MSKRAVSLVLCVLLFGSAGAGCGDEEQGTAGGSSGGDAVDSGSGDTAGRPDSGAASEELESTDLSRAEFTKQANAICRAGAKQVQEAFSSLSQQEGGNQGDGQAKLAESVASALTDNVDGIAELGAPSGDEVKIGELLDTMERASAQIEANPEKIQEGNQQVARATTMADRYGLSDCPFG